MRAQIDAVVDDLDIAAAKIGMIANKDIATTIAHALHEHALGSIIIDPVMVATSGDVLLEPDAQAVLKHEIIPQADLITPNIHEAALLTDSKSAQSESDIEQQAHALIALGCRAVLMKGGHLESVIAQDTLFTPDGSRVFSSPRIDTKNTHGTGCTLAAGITAALAQKHSLYVAVKLAKDYVSQAIASGAQKKIGSGSGPLDHQVSTGQHDDNKKK